MKKVLFKNLLLIIFLIFSFFLPAENSEKWYSKEELVEFLKTEKHVELYLWYTNQILEFSEEIKNVIPDLPLDAEETLLESVRENENNYLALIILGVYYNQVEEDYEKALLYMKKAIEVSPLNKRVINPYEMMAIIYYNLQEYEKVEEVYMELIKKFPEYPGGYYGMSVLRYNMKNYNEAVHYAKKSVTFYKSEKYADFFSPSYRKTRIIESERLLSYAYLKNGNYNEAFEQFFSIYDEMQENYNEEDMSEIVEVFKEENEKLKTDDKKLYEKNIKKFKELE